jgi:uncharacterized protein (UPF0276 family)
MPFCAYLGHGIGLRPVHYEAVIDERPRVDWLEVISENFMVPGGNPRRVLRSARERYPVALHGVSMSLGSTDPLDNRYLADLAMLAREIEPAWISDHLCWSSFCGHTAHDLWPLPCTEEAIAHVAARIAQVQDRLGRQILVENVSTYLSFRHSTLPEWEFLVEVAERADCGILLDVNNVHVCAKNNGYDPCVFLDAIPRRRVGQVHLAGHADEGTHFLDTHDRPVCGAVWDLYRMVVRRMGPVSTLVEWDDDIPPLARVVEESHRAGKVEADVLGRAEAPAHAS